jgi:hypothetical protein
VRRPVDGANEDRAGAQGGGRRGRSAAILLAAGSLAAALSVLPAASSAQQHSFGRAGGASSALGRAASGASGFCAKLPASKVSSTIGASVTLFEATVEKGSLECIYMGPEQVVVSKHPNIPASKIATRTKAEQLLTSESPKHVKISFASLPSVGATAFSWSYVLNGGKLLGVSDNKGTTGYGVVIGGSPTLIGSKDLSGLEHLLTLDMAA